MYCYPLKLYSFRSTRINNRSFTLSFRPLSISDKSVDEMFVIILKMTSLNLFDCKEVIIVYSDFNNQALDLTYIKLLASIISVVIYNFCNTG